MQSHKRRLSQKMPCVSETLSGEGTSVALICLQETF